ncbi:MAG: SPOR domain-containing protein [Spongiibacteraceae bacterium]|jgi:DedD protein|nr:SPOR domain-containing protein [Spongiibacteraceae bacterium]
MSGDKLRKRLVGAAVLLSVGVILWNWLLTDEVPIVLDRGTRLPAEPVIPRFEVPEPRKPADVAPVDTVLVDAIEPAVPPPDGLDPRGLPVAWNLQVASLSSAKGAEALKHRLQSGGHKAYVETTTAGGTTRYRVLVGPKLSREQAEQAKREIDRDFKVDTLIQRFTP